MKIRFPRMSEWLLLAVCLSLLVFFYFPQQIPVSLYKINLIAIGGVVGYWLDRSLFPYARPDRYCDDDFAHFVEHDLLFIAAQIRRALIVAAAMIAAGLGA